jgi:hypothetical protein
VFGLQLLARVQLFCIWQTFWVQVFAERHVLVLMQKFTLHELVVPAQFDVFVGPVQVFLPRQIFPVQVSPLIQMLRTVQVSSPHVFIKHSLVWAEHVFGLHVFLKQLFICPVQGFAGGGGGGWPDARPPNSAAAPDASAIWKNRRRVRFFPSAANGRAARSFASGLVSSVSCLSSTVEPPPWLTSEPGLSARPHRAFPDSLPGGSGPQVIWSSKRSGYIALGS